MKIKDEYKKSMPVENYRFVLMELYNYHHYHRNYEEMFKVGQELLNSSVICTTKIRED